MNDISKKYCPRFGQIALDMGFITEQQLNAALELQNSDDLRGRPHRLLGVILFEQEWMSASQIEEVVNALFKEMRKYEI